MELYLKIGALMEKHGFTNQSMADLSGIPIGTVSGIRSGKIQNPSFETICTMMQTMGVPLDELLDSAPASSPSAEPAQMGFSDQQQLIM